MSSACILKFRCTGTVWVANSNYSPFAILKNCHCASLEAGMCVHESNDRRRQTRVKGIVAVSPSKAPIVQSSRPQRVAVEQWFRGSGERKTMLEKLLLAMMITFSLNLFLGVRLPSKTQTVSSSNLLEMPTTLVRLLKKKQVCAGTRCLYTLGSSELNEAIRPRNPYWGTLKLTN